MMKKIIILLIILLLTSCTDEISNTSNIKKEKTFLGYISDSNNDMVLLLNTEVYLTTTNQNLKEKLVNDAISIITKYHMLLDSHHQYIKNDNSFLVNIYQLNNSIGDGPITVDPIIIDVFKEGLKLTKLTKGYFNITLGELSYLYHDKLLPYDTTNSDPNPKEIEKYVKGIIPYENIDDYIIINETNNTIELKENNYPYSIDLGAFSKGYIINKTYEELIKYDTSFLLNAGSSSIATYVSPNEDVSWSIGIKNPEKADDQILIFSLANGTVSTSGDYENYYYLEDGTKRHHILNPYTGYSENYYISNTLISSNACVIDALSTALFNVEEQNEFREILHNIENNYNIDISYLYIQNGLNIFMDKAFNERIIDNTPLSNNFSFTSTILSD